MKIKNPINACNLFATPTRYNDLLEWCEQHTGGEKVAAITAMHMTLNLAHDIVQQTLNQEEKGEREMNVTELWEIEKARWEDELWQAQLEFWPNSIPMTLDEVYRWCDEPAEEQWRKARWSGVALALQYPAVVFYKLKPEDRGLRGIRYGVKGHEYMSGFDCMKGE